MHIMATSNTAQQVAGTGRKAAANDMLGKDSFLQLLVVQLRHQDPLSPMDDRDFIAQMAQFSALEQMQNLNGQMLRLSAMSMLGQEVLILPTNGGVPTAGVVERVVSLNGSVQVSVNGQLYPAEWVNAVQLAGGEGQNGPQTL